MVDDNINIKSLWGDLPRVQKFEFVRNLTSFINDDNKTLTYWQCVAKYADDQGQNLNYAAIENCLNTLGFPSERIVCNLKYDYDEQYYWWR